eukprot:7380606-Prymnesium_polylepis.7
MTSTPKGQPTATNDVGTTPHGTNDTLEALVKCAPSTAELQRWPTVAQHLEAVVHRVLPGHTISLVGSAASGLALSGSDLDFELCPGPACAVAGGVADEELLQQLAVALEAEGMQRCQ